MISCAREINDTISRQCAVLYTYLEAFYPQANAVDNAISTLSALQCLLARRDRKLIAQRYMT